MLSHSLHTEYSALFFLIQEHQPVLNGMVVSLNGSRGADVGRQEGPEEAILVHFELRNTTIID